MALEVVGDEENDFGGKPKDVRLGLVVVVVVGGGGGTKDST